ncbi:MAG: FAD-dependent oxidoreductase [Bacteroidota bacterium]
MTTYDVVIIGSGLGGLLCGALLTKEGYRVCVAEKNPVIGGCLQTFVRGGCTFDTGIHYIGSLDPGQVLHRYFTYFGLMDRLHLKRMDADGFDVIHFDSSGSSYPLAMGAERFIETLHQKFPHEKTALVSYMKTLQEINGSLHLISLREGANDSKPYRDSSSSSAFNYIRSITSDRTLQQVLTGNNAIYAGDPARTSLLMHAVVQNFFIESSWRLVDGSSQLAGILEDDIKKGGGDVLTEYEAQQLVFEERTLRYVDFTNEERIQATSFISDIHPAATLRMLPPEMLTKAYRNRIRTLPNTPGVFSLYVVFHKNSFPYINSNQYHFTSEDVWENLNYSREEWPKGYMLLTPAVSGSGEFAEGMIIMTYMNFADVEQWSDTTVEARGADYRAFKLEMADRLLDAVERSYPGIRAHIRSVFTSTPLTYRDYTGTPQGSLYGVARDYNKPLESYIPPKTKIPNLFFTGQNTTMHGVLGVMIGSILTCSEFVGMDQLIRKINAAQ